MKTSKMIIPAMLALTVFAACQNGENNQQHNKEAATDAAQPTALMGTSDSTDTCASDIPVDSANKMISSYISSLNGNQDNKNLYSLIVDAKCLRTYLNNNPQVTNVKLMFAHTLSYINSGHQGQTAGYKSGELTMVIAGYDANGNYVLINGNEVMDNLQPCPQYCPSTGTAASNTIAQ